MTDLARFGLTTDPFCPFGPTVGPDGFYLSLGHEDCLARVTLAVHARRGVSGLSVITGASGYGKSTLLGALLDAIRTEPDFAIGVIDDPREHRTDLRFLRGILGQFGLAGTGRTGIDLTTEFLRYVEGRGVERPVLLVIDNGHHLSSSQLDITRALLNGESANSSPLAVVIFGEPELGEKIARKRNLARRVVMDHALNPLNRRDTGGLIRHRLATAGDGPDAARIFTDGAVDRIHEASGGVPRGIIDLSAACLHEAAAPRQTRIDQEIVTRVLARGGGDSVDPLAGDKRPITHHYREERPVQTWFPITTGGTGESIGRGIERLSVIPMRSDVAGGFDPAPDDSHARGRGRTRAIAAKAARQSGTGRKMTDDGNRHDANRGEGASRQHLATEGITPDRPPEGEGGRQSAEKRLGPTRQRQPHRSPRIRASVLRDSSTG